MISYRSFISVVLLIIFGGCTSDAQNIALGKPYQLSVRPNYGATSKDDNNTVLTDGVYTSSFFWNSDKTVGWSGSKRISIEIDLIKPSAIGAVVLNTARSDKSNVSYPSNVFVFISNNKSKYTYVGDLAKDVDNTSGDYKIKKFSLSGINQVGRYVRLIVIPNGTFFFSDEIEVTKGGNSNTKSQVVVSGDGIDIKVDSLLQINNLDKKTAAQLQNLKNGRVAIANGTDLTKELQQAKIDRLNSLKSKFKKDVIIDNVNPWSTLAFPYQPVNGPNTAFNISMMRQGVQYGAFVITNLTNTDRFFNCSVKDSVSNVSVTQLFSVPFVTSGGSYSEIADPLVPITDKVMVGPGESSVFMFKVLGKNPGTIQNKISIKSGTFTNELTLNVNVIDEIIPVKTTLNAVNWAYFSYPLISDRRPEAISDLYNHHINTFVVPPFVLPYFNGSDSKQYQDYIAGLKNAKNIFLYMDLKGSGAQKAFKNAAFLTKEWNANFINWYKDVVSVSKLNGITEAQLYIYPFDEVKDADLDNFSSFLKWLKVNYPSIKTFGTLTSVKAVSMLSPLLTVSQVLDEKGLLSIVDGSKVDIWTYTTTPQAESLSPYSFYRLKSWNAFYNDYNGVGFWNYADYRNGTTSKADLASFDGVNGTNYSVIYSGPGKTILSSRRWEAFKLGIEDYELLLKYSKKYGLSSAKLLAGKVINNPQDINMADVVRTQMLQSLKK